MAGKQNACHISSFSFPLTRSQCIIVLHSSINALWRGGEMANFPYILGARSLVSINFHARETDYVLLPLWSGSRLWRRSITIPATTPGAGFCARENESSGGIISGVVANSREMFSDISGRGGIISAMPNSYKTSY